MKPVIIQAKNVKKVYGRATILKDVSMDISLGEKIVLIGPSGSGKSTLLRCMAGLEDVDAGSVSYCNTPIMDKKLYEQTDIGVIFQSFDLFKHLTAKENVMLAPMKVKHVSKSDAEKKAMELLELVHLSERADYYPDELSGGQQQRIAIARALAMEPRLMFFDEPTSALDPEMTVEVLDIIVELVKKGMTVFIVTHEMEFARRVGDRVIFMDAGDIIADMKPEELNLETVSNPRIRQFLSQLSQYN